MNTHADKTQENKSQSITSAVSQMQSSIESTFQFLDNRPEDVAQMKLQEMANNNPQAIQLKAFQKMADNHFSQQKYPIQKKENNTGLPDNLKSGIENRSGYSMNDVKVHYNSDKPSQINAFAYTQGTDIHIASGQEKHLPHEAWHVVQQKQGRVRPTMQMKGGVNINDESDLEKEADEMGAVVIQQKIQKAPLPVANKTTTSTSMIIQGVFKDSAELREEKFIEKALSFSLSLENAKLLYARSGSNDPDPVTKLRTPADKEETRTLAREYAQQGALGMHTDKVFYANIKFYNLAGLNAAKGHAGADEIFGLMATHVDLFLNALRADYKVQGYRHEGSRFGFMITGDKNTLSKELIVSELQKAKDAWEVVKMEKGVDNIENPKRPEQRGIDLGFRVFEVDGNREQQDAEVEVGDVAQSPADAGIQPLDTSRSFQGAAPSIFKGNAESRKDTFEKLGQELGLSGIQIKDLYQIAGRSEKEPLTGFDAASDRIATLTNALHYFKDSWPGTFAGYVEVDVRNLGGLNDNLTRADSDNVFKFMSDTTDKHMRSLKADVVSFRHGGDEFSFVVVGRTGIVEINEVRTILSEAQIAIDAYVQHKKIWQKKKKEFTVNEVSGTEITLLNDHRLPDEFKDPFEKEKIMKNKPTIETNTEDELWRVYGKETYWLISNRGGKFNVYNIPLELTLNEILHSKDSPQKPRLPGTGIVWGASPIFREDESPIDVVARADKQVEQKKK